MSQIIPGLLYSKEHEWIEILNENTVRIGITDFAGQQLGDIVFVELPQQETHVEVDQSMGTVESVKAVSDVYSPVTGRVVDINRQLEDAPDRINADAYGEGWMVVVELTDREQLKRLLTAEQYTAFIQEQ